MDSSKWHCLTVDCFLITDFFAEFKYSFMSRKYLAMISFVDLHDIPPFGNLTLGFSAINVYMFSLGRFLALESFQSKKFPFDMLK